MAKIIEPPILISRILMFMLATSSVVLLVLIIALTKMVPLERPEIFFLLSPTRSVNVVVEPLVPDETNPQVIKNYEQGFIREYIIARNTLYASPDTVLTRKNWSNVVKAWSSPAVYSAFTKTALYSDYMESTPGEKGPSLSCSVNFSGKINDTTQRYNNNKDYREYMVDFTWICKNSGGQTTQKNYMIRIKINSISDKRPENLISNPLGTRVIEYKVLNVDGVKSNEDPLDSNWRLL